MPWQCFARHFLNTEDWISWYSAAVLHSEFFMKRGSRIAAPYDLLPNSVWKESEIMEVKDDTVRGDMLRQFNDGTRLTKIMCSGPSRSTMTVCSMAIQIFICHLPGLWLKLQGCGMILPACSWSGKQFGWIFGANPFGQSLMYGVGYDFAPQFAYCLKDVVGSLPVGMDCMSGDMPHWCCNKHCHKQGDMG